MTKNIPSTPSEFYRMIRPEYFSDSEIVYVNEMPKEYMAFELEKITTNNKHDEFETLCRKLAERLISPNLIPQVGPTGGGDGKTDSETHPVSEQIFERWFIPEKGWNKDQKWAFAFSAKKEWKSKVKDDVEKIVNTGRGYTKIFFITNQTPSSKKRKDAQDEMTCKYQIEVMILDGKWILEKIYDSNLLELAVETLNLSKSYLNKKVSLGSNDASRIKELEELEKDIGNPNRYSEYDHQLVEDALRAAILSRMLEKPREEIEGRFDRAVRFSKKIKNDKQSLRIHYQRAWTYFYWFNDFIGFIDEYKIFKTFISGNDNAIELELNFNLLNLLRGLAKEIDLSNYNIDFKKERQFFVAQLEKVIGLDNKPTSSLIAKTHKAILQITDNLIVNEDSSHHFEELTIYLKESEGHINYPFEKFKEVIEKFGVLFLDNDKYDELIEVIASLSEKRTSELASAELYIRRAGQHLGASLYKKSIIYFGKAITKLSKEESLHGLYLCFLGLSTAYSSLGLIWASNNCLVAAASLTIKSFYEQGKLDKKTVTCIKELVKNELFIGRVPCFLNWHELFLVLHQRFDSESKNNTEEEIPIDALIDGCFSVRVMNTNSKYDKYLEKLPDLLNNQALFLTEDACFYKLGYEELIASNYGEIDLDSHFTMVANQPFKDQMMFNTDFLAEDEFELSSIILGCRFIISADLDKSLILFSETLLAYFESFLATSTSDLHPNTETINLFVIRTEKNEALSFNDGEASNEFIIEVDPDSLDFQRQDIDIKKKVFELLSNIIGKNFYLNDIEEYLNKMFINEEVAERQAHVFEHSNFTKHIIGNNPKIILKDWVNNSYLKKYIYILLLS